MRVRWSVAILCFLATIVSYIDRQALSVNAPFIRDELGLSNVQYSTLVNAFLLAYTIGQAVTGRLVDALGARTSFAMFIAWWSVAGMLHASAKGVTDLALFRFLLGLGEAGSWPASMRAVSEWFPARERSIAVGLFGSGTAIGALVAVPIVARLTLVANWRWAFLITGALGVLWLIAWLAFYAAPERHPWLSSAERGLILEARAADSQAPLGYLALLGQRKAWGVLLGRLCVDPVWLFYVFWLPNYLKNARGFSLHTIELTGWIPFLTAYVGNVFGGWLSAHGLARGWTLARARRTVLALGAVGASLGVPASLVPEPWQCLTFISAATFSIGLWTTTAMTLNGDVVPQGSIGRMTGLSGVGSGLGSIAFTALTGWLVDHASYRPVFWLAGMLPLVGLAAVILLTGDMAPASVSLAFSDGAAASDPGRS